MLSYMFTVYSYGLTITGIILFNATPAYNNYARGLFGMDDAERLNASKIYEHALYFVLPFDADTKFRGYVVLHIFNW